MDTNTVPFDPTDVRAMNNPSFPSAEPYKVDTWSFIGQTIYVDPRRVKLMKDQPRTDAEQAGIREMAGSIRNVGQQEVASAFPITDRNYDVELIGGHRRTLACLEAKRMLQVHIRPVPPDRRQHYIAAVAGNCNREDLSLRDKVHAIGELLSYNCSYEEIATIFGETASWVRQYAVLGTLHPDIFPLLEGRDDPQYDPSGRKLRRVTMLTVGFAVEVARLPQDEQRIAAEAILEEGMNIGSVKQFVTRRLENNGIKKSHQRLASEKMRLLEVHLQRFDGFLTAYGDLSVAEVAKMRAERDRGHLGSIERRLLRVSQELIRLANLLGPIETVLEDCHPSIQNWIEEQLKLWHASRMPLETWMSGQQAFREVVRTTS